MYKLLVKALFVAIVLMPMVVKADIRLLMQLADGTLSVEQRINVKTGRSVIREAVQNSAGAINFLEVQLGPSSPQVSWLDTQGNVLLRQPLHDPRLTHQPGNTAIDDSIQSITTASQVPTFVTIDQSVFLITGPDEAFSLEVYLPEIAQFGLLEETLSVLVP